MAFTSRFARLGAADDVRVRLRGIGLPIIFLTGYAMVKQELHALDRGTVDFVDKARGAEVLAHRPRVMFESQQVFPMTVPSPTEYAREQFSTRTVKSDSAACIDEGWSWSASGGDPPASKRLTEAVVRQSTRWVTSAPQPTPARKPDKAAAKQHAAGTEREIVEGSLTAGCIQLAAF